MIGYSVTPHKKKIITEPELTYYNADDLSGPVDDVKELLLVRPIRLYPNLANKMLRARHFSDILLCYIISYYI